MKKINLHAWELSFILKKEVTHKSPAHRQSIKIHKMFLIVW